MRYAQVLKTYEHRDAGPICGEGCCMGQRGYFLKTAGLMPDGRTGFGDAPNCLWQVLPGRVRVPRNLQRPHFKNFSAKNS